MKDPKRDKPNNIILELKTPQYKIQYDLGEIIFHKENLRLAGIKKEEIVDVRPAFFKIDDHWYSELGVAIPEHPTSGSLGFECLTKRGGTCSFQVITYFDFNVEKDHSDGVIHWNNGGRIIDQSGNAHLVRELKGIQHKISGNYPWIKWSMIPGPEGKPASVTIHRPTKPTG